MVSISSETKRVKSDSNERQSIADELWIKRRRLLNEGGHLKLPSIEAVTKGDPYFGLGFDRLFPIEEGNPAESGDDLFPEGGRASGSDRSVVSGQRPGELLHSRPYSITNSKRLPPVQGSNVVIEGHAALHGREGSKEGLTAVVGLDFSSAASPPSEKRIPSTQEQPENPSNLRVLSTRLSNQPSNSLRAAALKLWTERFKHRPPTSREQIAERLGITLDVVDLAVNDSVQKAKFIKLSQQERDLLQDYVVATWNKLNQDGQRPTLDQIAADVDIPQGLVSQVLAMHKLRIPVPRSSPMGERAARICEEWTSMSWPSRTAFAKRHKIHPNTLTRVLRDCGLLA
ncbi:hypothetical protein FRB94_009342 [Tulasnella sp. JGI-2019a]|nr:hypothetical protein FRB94_009342 [Tulasnella sp. JGI-2019a]